jgi:hypothetical protein
LAALWLAPASPNNRRSANYNASRSKVPTGIVRFAASQIFRYTGPWRLAIPAESGIIINQVKNGRKLIPTIPP